MLRFPLDGLLDEQACYDFLLRILHPDGLHCPHGHPRRRANQTRGHGEWASDRPPIVGVVGATVGRSVILLSPTTSTSVVPKAATAAS